MAAENDELTTGERPCDGIEGELVGGTIPHNAGNITTERQQKRVCESRNRKQEVTNCRHVCVIKGKSHPNFEDSPGAQGK